MRIAVITPWPKERSGIADYSYDLVKGLAQVGADVTVFTSCSEPVPLGGVTLINGDCLKWDLNHFDVKVFHFGNNFDFHQHMLELLKHFGGIVHLHDYVLHHLVAGMAQAHRGWEWYFDIITAYYGASIAEQVKLDWERGICAWEGNSVLELPINDEVVAHADAIITHSQFAKKKILEKSPLTPIAHIEQVYDMNDVDQNNHVNFIFGVFGHVQPNKCIDQTSRRIDQN
ncbi:glycosyltransferase family protein [Pseudoalteromonas sp. GB56]